MPQQTANIKSSRNPQCHKKLQESPKTKRISENLLSLNKTNKFLSNCAKKVSTASIKINEEVLYHLDEPCLLRFRSLLLCDSMSVQLLLSHEHCCYKKTHKKQKGETKHSKKTRQSKNKAFFAIASPELV